MVSVLEGDSDPAIIAAIERNNVDLFLFAAAMGGKTILREEDFTGVIGKPWWPNYLVEPCFREETLESQIRGIREGIEQRKLPPLLKFGPSAVPKNLRTRLLNSGFVAINHNPPGMAMRLDGLGEERPIPLDLRIERVGDDAGLREWLSFFTLFEFDMFKVLMDLPEVRLYLGRIDGKAIGTSMMFLSSGVAGLYQVEVLPEQRRRGIGTAMTLSPMGERMSTGVPDRRPAGVEIG